MSVQLIVCAGVGVAVPVTGLATEEARDARVALVEGILEEYPLLALAQGGHLGMTDFVIGVVRLMKAFDCDDHAPAVGSVFPGADAVTEDEDDALTAVLFRLGQSYSRPVPFVTVASF